MDDRPARPEPRPRLTQALIGMVLVAQAVFAWIGLTGAEDPSAAIAAGDPARVTPLAAFTLYAGTVVAYLVALVQEARPLRWIGMVAAGAGIALALLRVAMGEPLDGLLFGIAIDALIVYGLQRRDIRALFPA